MPADDIGELEWQMWCDRLRRDGVSRSRVSTLVAVASAIYAWAITPTRRYATQNRLRLDRTAAQRRETASPRRLRSRGRAAARRPGARGRRAIRDRLLRRPAPLGDPRARVARRPRRPPDLEMNRRDRSRSRLRGLERRASPERVGDVPAVGTAWILIPASRLNVPRRPRVVSRPPGTAGLLGGLGSPHEGDARASAAVFALDGLLVERMRRVRTCESLYARGGDVPARGDETPFAAADLDGDNRGDAARQQRQVAAGSLGSIRVRTGLAASRGTHQGSRCRSAVVGSCRPPMIQTSPRGSERSLVKRSPCRRATTPAPPRESVRGRRAGEGTDPASRRHG